MDRHLMTDRERFAANRRAVQIHEAGHAIACLVLGHSIKTAMAWAGTGEVHHIGPRSGTSSGLIVVALAGRAAEELLGLVSTGPRWPTAAELTERPENDFAFSYRQAELMAGVAGARDLYERCHSAALDLVDAHWSAAARVATLLGRHTVVAGSEIAEAAAIRAN